MIGRHTLRLLCLYREVGPGHDISDLPRVFCLVFVRYRRHFGARVFLSTCTYKKRCFLLLAFAVIWRLFSHPTVVLLLFWSLFFRSQVATVDVSRIVAHIGQPRGSQALTYNVSRVTCSGFRSVSRCSRCAASDESLLLYRRHDARTRAF